MIKWLRLLHSIYCNVAAGRRGWNWPFPDLAMVVRLAFVPFVHNFLQATLSHSRIFASKSCQEILPLLPNAIK